MKSVWSSPSVKTRCSLVLASLVLLTACGASNKPEDLVAEGQKSLAKQDYTTAMIQFKSALQKDPQAKDARVLLGKALLQSADPAGAVVELTKAREEGASANETVPLLAQALIANGDYKKLVNAYGAEKLSLADAQADLLTSISYAWRFLGDKDRATAAMQAAVSTSPQATPVLLMQVDENIQKGDVAAARNLIDSVLAKDASKPQAWIYKGSLLSSDIKNDADAQSAFKKAIELDKMNVTARVLLISLQLRAKDFAGAKAQLAALSALRPKDPWTSYAMAQVAFAEGKYDAAREVTQKLLEAAPDDAAIQMLAGAMALQNRELIQAETHYSKALQLSPQQVGARLGLATVYLRLGRPAQTLATLKPLLTEGGTEAVAMGIAGEAELALGDAAAAEKYFLRATALTPNDPGAKISLAMNRLSSGSAQAAFADLTSIASESTDILAEQAAYSARLRRGDFAEALVAVEQIKKKQPGNSNALEMQGKVYLAKRDYAQARMAFEAQVKENPKALGAAVNLAAIDLIEKKPEEARKRLQLAIQADPKNMYPMLALAQLQTDTGAPLDEIRQLYLTAIQVQPRAPEPRLALIRLALRKRLYKEALVAAQEAAAALPSDPVVMDEVGRAQMEAGDVEQALSTFRRMAGADSRSGLAYTRLADMYMRSGKRDQAELSLRRALEIEPELVPAQIALADLLIRVNRKADAIEISKRMQRDAPSKPAGYSMEAVLHLRLNQLDQALASYRIGLAKTGAASMALGVHQVLGYLRKLEEADRFADAWLTQHPKDIRFGYQVAELAIASNRLDDAVARLTHLTKEDPENVLALNNLASTLTASGKPGAVPFAEKAVSLAPSNGLFHDTLAFAYAAGGQLDKALATQKRAVELAPDSALLRLGLARLAIQAGDKALARQELTSLKPLGAKFTQQDEVTRLLKTL
jgi:putative PEP-CTERM system TPR-repeat lipoprotein